MWLKELVHGEGPSFTYTHERNRQTNSSSHTLAQRCSVLVTASLYPGPVGEGQTEI